MIKEKALNSSWELELKLYESNISKLETWKSIEFELESLWLRRMLRIWTCLMRVVVYDKYFFRLLARVSVKVFQIRN